MVRKKVNQTRMIDEFVIQKFPNRCPYCEEPISYDSIHLKIGDNEVECPFCKRKFIKVVSHNDVVS